MKQNNLIKNKCELFFNLIKTMIEIVNGKIFVEGKETVDPTLIGYALLDFAENQDNDGLKIVLKEQDVFVESFITEV